MSNCDYRRSFGVDACLEACAAVDVTRTFHYARVERAGDVPAPDPRIVDVALLDMHHGWPNLGHDALVQAVKEAVCDACDALQAGGLAVRVISYDVRRAACIPERPGRRHSVYVGTGGPGHLDPRKNDGVDPGSQGITENPGWEPRLFNLLDAVVADASASLLGVCHTFGVLCRWLGIADAALRPERKGGKSTGIVDNVLTADGRAHPWFGQFASRLPDGCHFPVLDNRLYDLLPTGGGRGARVLASEALGSNGPAGDAITMIEVARFRDAPVPRVLGVNHHPEIVDRARNLTILRLKRERGEVSDEWYAERLRTLTQTLGDDAGERQLQITSEYTLLGPLRFALYRALQSRAAQLGVALSLPPPLAPAAADAISDASVRT